MMLSDRLRRMVDEMRAVAEIMAQSPHEWVREHGKQLSGASDMAETWATGMVCDGEDEEVPDD